MIRGRARGISPVLLCCTLALGVPACGGEPEKPLEDARTAAHTGDGVETDPTALLNQTGDAVLLRGGEQLARVSLLTDAGRDELTSALAELAGEMPHTEDMDRWPLGRVRIEVEGDAPFIHVLEFMICCAAREVCIWNLEIAGLDEAGAWHPIPLPHELGGHLGPAPTELWVVVEPSEGTRKRQVEYTLCTDGRLITDPEAGSAMFRSRDERMHFRQIDLGTFESVLTELTYPRDETILFIDARPRTLYRDIEPLLPLVHHKGIDEIQFAIPRD